MSAPTTIRRFKGLTNVSDALRTGPEWLARADNIDITDTGSIEARTGFTKTASGSITGAYNTADHARMYFVDGGVLKAKTDDGAVSITAGLSQFPVHFTEINDQVFFNNGVDSGVINPDNEVLTWRWTAPTAPNLAAVSGNLDPGLYQVRCVYVLADGRATGASDAADIELVAGQALQISGIPQAPGYTTRVYIAPANSTVYGLAFERAPGAVVWNAPATDLGRELRDTFAAPLPSGVDVVQAWRGRIYGALYFAELGQSAVFVSLPLGFHLFDLSAGFSLPGRVLMMAPHADGLVIGTDQGIHVYTGATKELLQVASYGVTPGWHWAEDDADASGAKRILFWSVRGVCSALPFSNLTESTVSVAPGVSAGGAIVRKDGQKRFVVALKQGGLAFNSRN